MLSTLRSQSMLRGPSQIILALVAALCGLFGPRAGVLAADVDVKLLHFGVGDVARSGGPLALQLEFRSALDQVAEIEAVWELPNADLDVTEFSRSFVLNPGQAQRRWIYGVLPPMGEGALGSAVFELRLYELAGGRRVRDLGTARIGPAVAENAPRIVAPDVDMILVVGARSLGLDILSNSQRGASPSMHNATIVANIRDADAFPDRWEGFAPFESLIWASGAIGPSRLSEENARAITEWTERGGNFVITLPSAGDPWAIGSKGAHALSSVLPPAPPRRIEGVRVRDLIQLLSVQEQLRKDDAEVRIAVFEEASLKDGWRPFIAIPAPRDGNGLPVLAPDRVDGRVIGVRAALGYGKLTVIGLDVDELAAQSLQTPPIPQVDVFWNRVLGRRADTPSGAEIKRYEEASRIVGTGGYTQPVEFGKAVSAEIGLAGKAALGVLAATAVFALYWLCAGPLGFAILKTLKRERWSWVAYVGIAGLFTVAIFLIGGTVSGRQARIQHLTVLDMVEPAQGESDLTRAQHKRALGWVSLFAPNYGSVEVALDPKADPTLRNRLASWRAPSSEVQGFPSRERYRAPLDEPSRLAVPSRSTSIDFETRWLGAVDPKWGLFPRATAPVVVTVDRNALPNAISIAGKLVHSLPSTLRDVQILHVWPIRNPLTALTRDGNVEARRMQGQLPNRGDLVIVPKWDPGTELDLSRILSPRPVSDQSLQSAISQRYYASLYSAARNFTQGLGLGGEQVNTSQAVELLTFYSMLQPPPYIQNPPASPNVLRITRQFGRELDLSTWFTEPCLVVMGRLDDVALPYPLTVDGEQVPSSGTVYVRWILPLPGDPARIVPERVSRAQADRDAARESPAPPAEPGAEGEKQTESP